MIDTVKDGNFVYFILDSGYWMLDLELGIQLALGIGILLPDAGCMILDFELFFFLLPFSFVFYLRT